MTLASTMNQRNRRLSACLACLGVMLVAGGIAYWNLTARLLGTRITTSEFDGLNLSPSMMPPGPRQPQFWEPSRDDILAVEEAVKEHVHSDAYLRDTLVCQDLSGFRRRYVGVVKDGRRFLTIWFLHSSNEEVSNGDWLTMHFGVAGGGDHYWNAWYDVESRAFTEFFPNSPR